MANFGVTCDGVSVAAKNLWVKSGMKATDKAILELDNMSARGQVQITLNAVRYTATVDVGDSTGNSDGVVDFEKGF